MATTTKTDERRERLVTGLVEATKPGKTGKFCFDFYAWEGDMPILHLGGDHGTPDFTLTFLEGGRVRVSPDSNPSWAKTLESTFEDNDKLVQDILATMLVIDLTGSIR